MAAILDFLAFSSLSDCFDFRFRELQRVWYYLLIGFWGHIIQDGCHGGHLGKTLLLATTQKVIARFS